jgi:acyl-CoA synthetase (AMP-forming)/AMP-acid ligase II
MPFFWVGGLVFSLLSAMHAGACLLCEEAFEPGATLLLLERERATIAAGWPHYAKAMMDHPSFPLRDLSSVRAGNLYAVLPEAVRPRDPELRSNSLGMTETAGPHTIDRMDVDLPERLRGSFGHAVPGLEHKIVDPETGVPLAPGESGEICVRGYSLMQALHKVEREETFDRDGYYPTGDLGRFDADGVLFFQARKGDLIKTAGANVSPREVEVLIEAMPEVQAAFVVGLPDPVRGQEVAAAVVLDSGRTLEESELRERLRKDLAAYKVPRHVVFAAKAELPFTDTGKIDKRRLAELLAARLRGR